MMMTMTQSLAVISYEGTKASLYRGLLPREERCKLQVLYMGGIGG